MCEIAQESGEAPHPGLVVGAEPRDADGFVRASLEEPRVDGLGEDELVGCVVVELREEGAGRVRVGRQQQRRVRGGKGERRGLARLARFFQHVEGGDALELEQAKRLSLQKACKYQLDCL